MKDALETLIEKFGPDSYIDITVESSNYYESCYITGTLVYKHEETDEEMEARIKHEEEYREAEKKARAERKEKQKLEELETLARLKKKYEGA